MKITRSFKIQSLILAAALSIGLGFVSPVSARERYHILDTNSQQLTELGTLGGSDTYASAINDRGQVVGSSTTTTGEYHAFITGPNGVGMTDLGSLGGSFSGANDVNDAGQVVGYSTTATGEYHAFITGPNGVGMTDLGTVGGFGSFATDINNAGQVVGTSSIATGEGHAFITGPNGAGMTDLGTLGGNFSYTSSINDVGQGVGYSSYFLVVAGVEGDRAFITDPNGTGMTDLNSLVELPAGNILRRAIDINNAGQVLVYAEIPEPPPIPEPQSYALMLAGLILVGFAVQRKSLPAKKSWNLS